MRASTKFLGSLALGFTLVSAALLWHDETDDASPIQPATRRPGSAAAALAAAADPPGLLQTILAHALFAPDRDQLAGAAAPPDRSGLPRLSGTLIGPQAREAILVPRAGGKPISLSEGGKFGPWQVVAIVPGSVLLDGPEGRRSLRTEFIPASQSQSQETLK